MKKLFKVTDNKYDRDITEDCYMDSDGDVFILGGEYDNYNLDSLTGTFQKDGVKYERYTVEKYI